MVYGFIAQPEGQPVTKDEARTDLLRRMAPGDTVYTIVRHVTRRQNRKHLDLLLIQSPGTAPIQTESICKSVAVLMGWDRAPDGTILTRESPEIVIARLSQELFGNANELLHRSL